MKDDFANITEVALPITQDVLESVTQDVLPSLSRDVRSWNDELHSGYVSADYGQDLVLSAGVRVADGPKTKDTGEFGV